MVKFDYSPPPDFSSYFGKSNSTPVVFAPQRSAVPMVKTAEIDKIALNQSTPKSSGNAKAVLILVCAVLIIGAVVVYKLKESHETLKKDKQQFFLPS
jgi:uncharacterized protein HemX